MPFDHLSPAERSRQASIAGLTGWANTVDRSARGRAGYNGLLAKFAREADPEGTLTPAERSRRAKTLYKLHMQKITQASLAARKAKREAAEQQAAAMKARRDSAALRARSRRSA
jgi:hypothetical protein